MRFTCLPGDSARFVMENAKEILDIHVGVKDLQSVFEFDPMRLLSDWCSSANDQQHFGSNELIPVNIKIDAVRYQFRSIPIIY